MLFKQKDNDGKKKSTEKDAQKEKSQDIAVKKPGFFHRLKQGVTKFSLFSFLGKKKKKKKNPLGLPSPRKFHTDDDLPTKQSELHPCEAYNELKMTFRDIGRMDAILETLGRDFLTAMPEGAYKSRLGQISFLKRRMHEDLINDDVHRHIMESHEHQQRYPDQWDIWDVSNLREMENLYRQSCHVSPEMVEQQAGLLYEGRSLHRDVMRNNDWETARPFLEANVDLAREIAERKCLKDNDHPTEETYQALMRHYAPGMRLDEVDKLFNTMEGKLKRLLPQILDKQAEKEAPIPLSGDFPVKDQMWLNRKVLGSIGFDFKRGGLYETGYNPVEGGTPDDTHLVIRNASIDNFLISLKSTLHEGGHGIYVQGLPRKLWRYQPVAKDQGTALHESQALLVEMILSRTIEFFTYLSPRIQGLFHKFDDPSLSPENLWKLKNCVQLGPDRKTADEVTYFFHVKFRMELEREMISGKLKVKDLPEAWNAKVKEKLDYTPQTYSEGCLQDVHWFVGKFGYFPAYSLGHMIGAQFYETMKRDLQNIPDLLRQGDLVPIRDWLNDKIHKYGRLKRPDELIRDVTGKPLSVDPAINHLTDRYLYNSF